MSSKGVAACVLSRVSKLDRLEDGLVNRDRWAVAESGVWFSDMNENSESVVAGLCAKRPRLSLWSFEGARVLE